MQEREPGNKKKAWPTEFRLYINGFFGTSYTVELEGETLRYQAVSEEGHQEVKTVTPTSKQWETFWSTLERIGVWNWKSDYPNPGILDGTQWDITLEYSGRTVTSQGDNAYPNEKAFNAFLDAISRLIGGLPFE